MKKLLLGFAVLGAIAVGVWIYRSHHETSRFETVAIHDNATGETVIFGHLTDQLGHESQGPRMWESGKSVEKVTLLQQERSTKLGRPAVTVHLLIDRPGISTRIDRTIALSPFTLPESNWPSLDDHFKIVAFADGPTIQM
jgi:hypothetical protein